MSTRLLLGPQRPERYLGQAVASAKLPTGPMAIIAAGWQEGEDDVSEVSELLERPLENLRLWERSEELFQRRPELQALYRARQDRLLELQRLYRVRLKHLATATRTVLQIEGDAELVEPERRHAVAQIRALDRHHLQRVESVHRDFAPQITAAGAEELARHARAVHDILSRHPIVIITGGNIGVLLNRMRLFDVHRMIARHALVAWSAGAMVLAERIVLYHDNTPEGRRDAEILGAGFGFMRGYVFLPNTDHRLRHRKQARVELLARRFSPEVCVALNNGTILEHDGQRVIRSVALQRLRDDGILEELSAA